MSRRHGLSTLLPILLILLGCDQETGGRQQIHDSQFGDSTGQFLSVDLRESLRDSLRSEGLYDCCTDPDCLECSKKKDGCGCYLKIKLKEPICGECLEGYKAGHGKLKLVSIPELERIQNSGHQP